MGQDPYAQQPYSPPPGAGYQQEGAAYPNQPYFSPPPGAPYSPNAEYQAPGGPAPQIHPDYGYPPQQGGYAPPVPNAYSPPPGAAPYAAGNPGPRRADENVSAEKSFHNTPNDDVPLYNSSGAPFYFDPNSSVNMSVGEGG